MTPAGKSSAYHSGSRVKSARVARSKHCEGRDVTVKSREPQVKLGEELALVISCETTVKVLVVLVEREASPKEIAERLGMRLSTVCHHVTKLAKMGLIEEIDEKEVGSAVQHIYRAVVRPIVSAEAWGKLSVPERERYSVWILRMLLTDASVSLNAGLFDVHPNRHLSRVPLVLDAEGFSEAAEIQKSALNDLMGAEAASAGRMARSQERGMNVIAGMTFFEIPEPSSGLSARLDAERDRD
jgi:DNA-binding transcriptional ArsR family regulator